MEKLDQHVMRMARQAVWSEAEGGRVIEAWRRSGETIAEYARRYAIAPYRLYYWRTRSGKKGSQGSIREQRARKEAPMVGFHSVRVLPAPVDAGDRGDGSDGAALEIRWIRIRRGMAAEDMRAVLAALGMRE